MVRALAAVILLPFVLLLTACGDWRLFSSRPSGELRTISEANRVELKPQFRAAVYRSADAQSAEVYLTDLPLDRLNDLDDNLADLSGTIVQISIFMQPKAGRTPISDDACNAAIRQLVLSGPARGLYGGGGFVVPTGIGTAVLKGSVRGATLRMIRSTESFADPLGPSVLEGSFRAGFDANAARVMAQRMAQLAGSLKEVKAE